MNNAPASDNPGQKTVMRLYGAFSASVILMCVPLWSAAALSVVLLTGVLIAALIIRKQAAPQSLIENHMIYMIRTIWITCLLCLAALLPGGMYLISVLDLSAIIPCAGPLSDMLAAQSANPDIAALSRVIAPCRDTLIANNMAALITATFIAAAPPLLYLVLRISRGLSRAAKGYRIANPRTWL
jgi:uncharacterized membrane protein